MSDPCKRFVHDGSGPDVDPLTGDEAETEELREHEAIIVALRVREPEGVT